MSQTAKGAINPIDLDTDLEDIDDLPSFRALPTGAYRILLEKGFEEKKINEHPALEMAMTVLEVLELNPNNLDDDEEPPITGDIATQSFMLDNEFGVGILKQVMKPIGKALGVSKLKEIAEQSKGMELIAVIKRRKGKKGTDNEDKNFMNITKLSVE